MAASRRPKAHRSVARSADYCAVVVLIVLAAATGCITRRPNPTGELERWYRDWMDIYEENAARERPLLEGQRIPWEDGSFLGWAEAYALRADLWAYEAWSNPDDLAAFVARARKVLAACDLRLPGWPTARYSRNLVIGGSLEEPDAAESVAPSPTARLVRYADEGVPRLRIEGSEGGVRVDVGKRGAVLSDDGAKLTLPVTVLDDSGGGYELLWQQYAVNPARVAARLTDADGATIVVKEMAAAVGWHTASARVYIPKGSVPKHLTLELTQGRSLIVDELALRRYLTYSVHEGMILAPIAEALWLAPRDRGKALRQAGLADEEREQWAALVLKFAQKWSDAYREVGPGQGVLAFSRLPDERNPGHSLPHNQYLVCATTLLYLEQILPEGDARERVGRMARGLGQNFRARVEVEGAGRKVWRYWDECLSGEERAQGLEDVWHSNLDVEFVDAALRFGEIFGEEERAEFAATFVRGYVASPGVLRMYPTGSAREARGVPPTFGWARLARQDESLRQAIMPVLRNLHDEGAEAVGNYPHTAGHLAAAAAAAGIPLETGTGRAE